MTITLTPAPAAARSLPIESYLDQFECSWDFATVTLADIDDTLSKRNQARTEGAIIPDLVERYTRDAQGGAKFPPLIVARDGTKVYVLDGNNRRAALTAAGITAWPAYIIDATATVAALIARTANTTNGRPLTSGEQQVLVHDLHAQGTFTRTQIASMAGVTPSVADRIIKAEIARRRASNRRQADKVGDTVMVKIGSIQPTEALDLLVAAVATGQVSGDAAAAISVAARRIDNDADRIAHIIEATKTKIRPKKGGHHADPDKLNRSLGSILAVNPTVVGLTATPEQIDALAVKIDLVVAHLAAIKKAL